MPLDCRKPPLASCSCVCAVIPSPADTRAMKSRTVREKKKKRVENVLTTDDTKRLCTQPPIVAPCHPSPGIKGAECLWRAGPKPSHPTLVFHPPPHPLHHHLSVHPLWGDRVCVYMCVLCVETPPKREREREARLQVGRRPALSFFFSVPFVLEWKVAGHSRAASPSLGTTTPTHRAPGAVCVGYKD